MSDHTLVITIHVPRLLTEGEMTVAHIAALSALEDLGVVSPVSAASITQDEDSES